jgi:hypothetical protein
MVVDIDDGACLVECPQCGMGRPADIPIGIGLRLFDRIPAELLAENHRGEHRRLAATAERPSRKNSSTSGLLAVLRVGVAGI